MRKVLILIALLFTVVCYAAPPPDEVPVYQPDQVQLVIQDNINVVNPVMFEAQEVAYIYRSHFEMQAQEVEVSATMSCVESTAEMQTEKHNTGDVELNKPPSFYCNDGVNINKAFQGNMQHSNYGYPFTGDRC